MKKAYVTILSSDGFVKGVIALHKGLKRYSREEFAVFTGPEVSEPVKEELRRNNINIIEVDEPSIDLSGVNDVQLRDRWIKTLFKLVVFKDYGYEKLVYLDSDLLIRGSLDELFDKPAISAVSDRAFFPQFSRGGLNAGVMVIEPDEKLYEALCKEIPKVAAKGTAFGDQDVINSYLSEWDSEAELHLDIAYNTCFYDCERVDNPKVVHFILESKPWMWSRKDVLLKKIKWFVKGKRKQIKYLNEYLNLPEE
ncbi:MAG: hypothetical protein IKX87_10200 [Lachnospiraceae bacterium]|nr:hypothetical protein [Lachnospiraceae bacterium]